MAYEGRYLHFRCEWIVFPLEASAIHGVFLQRHIPIGLLGGGSSFHTPEGYWAIPIIARVDSETVLADFTREFGIKVGLTDWIPVPEDWSNWQSIMISAVPDFIKGIQTMGRWNQKLREQLESSG